MFNDRLTQYFIDFLDNDGDSPLVPKAKIPKATKAKAAKADGPPKQKKTAAAPKPKPAKSAAAKPKKASSPKKKAARKDFSDSDSEEVAFVPKAKAGKVQAQKRSSFEMDGDFSDAVDVDVGAKRGTARAKKVIKYDFSDSDESDM